MEIVTIRRQDQYTMPKICCACGEPAQSGRLVTSGFSRSSGRFANFSFPLCDRCAQLSKTVNRRRRIARWVSLGLVLFLSVLALVISYAFETVPDVSFFTFLGSLALLVPLALLGMLIAQWLVSTVGLRRDVRQAFRRVLKAVRVKRFDDDVMGRDGYITFAFVNKPFADLFQEMNAGVVLSGKLGELA